MTGFSQWLKRDFAPMFIGALMFVFSLVLIFTLGWNWYYGFPFSLSENFSAPFWQSGLIALVLTVLFKGAKLIFSVKSKEQAQMSIQTDIAIEDKRWSDLNLQGICDQAVISTCAVIGGTPTGELSLAFVNDVRIQELNREYRDKDKPTNVLSFPMEGMMLGDIVLSYETIKKEAIEQGKIFENHLSHLIIHGFLHLLGYDHQNNEDAAEMETLEISALSQLGIDNPYELKQF